MDSSIENSFESSSLNATLEKEVFDHKPLVAVIDEMVANELLKGLDPTQAARSFVSHMSFALRAGHLCVTPLLPVPSAWWRRQATEEAAIAEQQWEEWNQLIAIGAQELPPELLGKNIIKDRDRYYFQRYWTEETRLLHHCHRLICEGSPFSLDQALIEKELVSSQLLPEQKRAIKMVIDHPFSLLAGGPGTGKTYTVGILLKVLWNCMNEQERCSFRIGIAAPTGKAAAQLQSSLSRALEGTAWKDALVAKTLHSMLGINPFSRDKRPRLGFNLLIIDESSMVDAKMMGRLLSSIPSETHILFVGDPDQLPAVDVGSIFSDLIDALGNKGCYTQLKTCLRAELEGILFFAQAVNSGNTDLALSGLGREGVEFEELDFTYKDLETLQRRFGHFYEYSDDPAKALDEQRKFCLLSPLRRGMFGVDKLNKHFMERKKNTLSPIIITGNAPDLDLFNGKLGLISDSGDAFFLKNDGSMRTISSMLLPKYDLAYCLSVHKSQGSEFDEILFVLPPRSEVFGRQILYTGITRAKKKVILWGTKERMRKIIEFCPQRISGLATRLQLLIGLTCQNK
jgi:exodeoxyribonuclease V alpha subunit